MYIHLLSLELIDGASDTGVVPVVTGGGPVEDYYAKHHKLTKSEIKGLKAIFNAPTVKPIVEKKYVELLEDIEEIPEIEFQMKSSRIRRFLKEIDKQIEIYQTKLAEEEEIALILALIQAHN